MAGFHAWSTPVACPKAIMIGHYTTGLHSLFTIDTDGHMVYDV